MNKQTVIRTDRLTKSFGKFTAVNKISFDVFEGEIFGFLGANGAGKTTAMKMLIGILKPTSGAAAIAGYDIYKQTEQIKKNIGYMSQKFSLYDDLTIMEIIQLFGGIYGLSDNQIKERSNELIEKLNLVNEAKKPVELLPLGWKQKLAFSLALLHRPQIVFLDEPTSGVDPITRRQFWDMIYEAASSGTTVFVTTHYMDEAEYCNRVCILVDGEIKALNSPGKLKEIYNTNSMNDVFVMLARSAKRHE
jgi:ABC-2 type transport system ATP-binding protein